MSNKELKIGDIVSLTINNTENSVMLTAFHENEGLFVLDDGRYIMSIEDFYDRLIA